MTAAKQRRPADLARARRLRDLDIQASELLSGDPWLAFHAREWLDLLAELERDLAPLLAVEAFRQLTADLETTLPKN